LRFWRTRVQGRIISALKDFEKTVLSRAREKDNPFFLKKAIEWTTLCTIVKGLSYGSINYSIPQFNRTDQRVLFPVRL
jgi:outer membrane receptor for Fe3+-dicitrate